MLLKLNSININLHDKLNIKINYNKQIFSRNLGT